LTTYEQGSNGPQVADIHRRLRELGYDAPSGDQYDEQTAAAIREFQEARGLYVDGRCGRETWGALLESAWKLGDRLLYLRSPMVRGDDVEELQHRLNALGFDAGREDGMFGPRTLAGLREFQRNAGIAVDGICGPATLVLLRRLGTLAAGSIARVRELEAFHSLAAANNALRVCIFAVRAMSVVADVVSRRLSEHGAEVLLDVDWSDEHESAEVANQFDADLGLALRVGEHPGFVCRSYGNARTRSAVGSLLAHSIVEEFAILVPVGTAAIGTNTMLRATRMPTVVCEFPATDVERLRDEAAIAGSALVAGLQRALASAVR